MMDTPSAPTMQGFEGYRLSPQQRAIWLAQRENGGNAFGTRCMLLLQGNLDKGKLQQTLERIVGRHQILRTEFRSLSGMAVPLQVVVGDGAVFLEAIDLSDCDSPTQAARLEALFEGERRGDFDFEGWPLRSSLIALAPDKHALLIGLPALCADSATLHNLASEIGPAYASVLQGADDTTEAASYLQFSEWQNQLLEAEDADREAGREFWAGNFSPVLTLPFQKERAEQSVFKPDSLTCELDAAVEGRHDPAVFLLACWQILLSRLTGEPGIAVHVLSDCRQYEEFHDTLGFFAKYLPIHCRLSGDSTFSNVLDETARALSEAREWQDYWESCLEAGKDAIAFECEEQPAPYRAAGVAFSLVKQYCCIERYKLKLAVTKKAARAIGATLYYDPQAFDRDTIGRIGESFTALLQSTIRDPDCEIGKLSILSAAERRRLLFELNRTRTDQADHRCVHQWFEDQVKRTPNEVALVCGDQRLTYTDLNARANRLAHYLRRNGVAPDVCIPLCVESSAEALVGVLGILKAGGAYVALHPEHPKARLAHQLSEIGAAVLLSQQSLLDALPEFAGEVICLDDDQTAGESENDPSPAATLDGLVYVLYTSGSTGTPKGVAVTHRSLSNYTEFIHGKLGLEHKRLAFATVSTLSADLGNTCIFPCLVSGGCLHVLSYEVATDAAGFAEYVARHPIDVLKIVPSHLKTLLDSDAAILPRKYLILGGEASSWKLIEKIAKRGGSCRVINHYGPTETTVGSLTFDLDDECSASATVPIGRPIANTRVYVLDPYRNPVPIGVAGELHIGGAGLARGYLNRLELTAEKFVSNPFSEDLNSRLYRTGDLVRYLPDGNIEFLGRIDNQIKIRGFRIELGEIEAALAEHPDVRQAAVHLWRVAADDVRIVACCVPARPGLLAPISLRKHLRARLPEYMVPQYFLPVDEIPLTPNGKVDRRRLPTPVVAESGIGRHEAPADPIEATIAEIWTKLIQPARPIGRFDRFFEMGGHSLLGVKAMGQIEDQLGVRIPFRVLFQENLADIATRCRSERNAEEGGNSGGKAASKGRGSSL